MPGFLPRGLICVAVLVVLVAAVDKSKFRTCDQLGFCRRQVLSKAEPRNSLWTVKAGSVSATGHVVKMELLHTGSGIQLPLTLTVLASGVVRIQVRESAPLHPRYEVQDVLLPEVEKMRASAKVETSDAATTVVTTATAELRVRHAPFMITASVGGKEVLRLNSHGLFHFEHLRERPTGKASSSSSSSSDNSDGKSVPQAASYDEAGHALDENGNVIDTGAPAAGSDDSQDRDEGMWEERHRDGKKDLKPRGPEAVGMDIAFVGMSHIYGIPEHATDLNLKSTVSDTERITEPYRLYNLDVFEYILDSPMALYGGIPYLLGHRSDANAGVLWLNSAETWIDVYRSDRSSYSHWISESGIVDVFLLLGENGGDPQDLFSKYAGLTGTTPQPQMFSIAYHQCRWNYKDEEDVAMVDAKFDEHDIPLDVIWLDIEHTDGKKYFTWNSQLFPNPEKMQKALAEKSRKMVTIIDPHIKKDSSYGVYKAATAKDLFVKTQDGDAFTGFCWPGDSSYLDFTNPVVRDFWASRFAYNQYLGSTPSLYTWNDMNEPSVFTGPEVSMDKHLVHHNGWEHRHVHQLYGFYNSMATYQGLLERNAGQNDRPFALTRAFFAGSQRYAAVWTGDNAADWGHLAAAQPMIMSMNLAGLPFVGSDVGGFFGNPDNELLVRWYQVGAFHPFFRAHAHIDTKRREPWLFGDQVMARIRTAIRTRYTLLQYIYTVYREHDTTGMPVMRPLWLHFPGDEETFDMQDQFMLGDALMVAPISEYGKTSRPVYLPDAATWYTYPELERASAGVSDVRRTLDQGIPVFQRGGSILVRKDRVRRSSALMAGDPVTLVIALAADGTARGRYYADDGASFAYRNGDFVHRDISVAADGTISCRASALDTKPGFMSHHVQVAELRVAGLRKAPSRVTLAGVDVKHRYDAATGVLVIAKPGVGIAEDWDIRVEA